MLQSPSQETPSKRSSSQHLMEFSKVRDLMKREKNLVQPQSLSFDKNLDGTFDSERLNPTSFNTPVRNPKNLLATPENQRISVISEEAEFSQIQKKFFTAPKRQQGDEQLQSEKPRERDSSQVRHSCNIEELENEWSRMKKQHNFDTRGSSPNRSLDLHKISPRKNAFELKSFQERRQTSCEQRKMNKEKEIQAAFLLAKGVPQAMIDLSTSGSLAKESPKARIPREGSSANKEQTEMRQSRSKTIERGSPLRNSMNRRKMGAVPGSSELDDKVSKDTMVHSSKNSLFERTESQASAKNEDNGPIFLLSGDFTNNTVSESNQESLKTLVKSRNSIKSDERKFREMTLSPLINSIPSLVMNSPQEKKSPPFFSSERSKNPAGKKVEESGKTGQRRIEKSPGRAQFNLSSSLNAQESHLFSTSLVTYLPKGQLAHFYNPTIEDNPRTKGAEKMQTLLRSIKKSKTNVPEISTAEGISFTAADLQTPMRIKSPQLTQQAEPLSDGKKNKSHLKERKNKEDYSDDIEEGDIVNVSEKQIRSSAKKPLVFETKAILLSLTRTGQTFNSVSTQQTDSPRKNEYVEFDASEEKASATLKKKVQEKVLKISQTIKSPVKSAPKEKEKEDKPLITPRKEKKIEECSLTSLKKGNTDKFRSQKQKQIMSASFKPPKSSTSGYQDQSTLSMIMTPKAPQTALSMTMTPKLVQKILPVGNEAKIKYKPSVGSVLHPENQTMYWDTLKKKYVINLRLQA